MQANVFRRLLRAYGVANLGRVWLMIAGVVGVLAATNDAHAYRRHGYSSYNSAAARQRQQQMVTAAANQQIAAAKQVLAAAESTGGAAQSKLDAAMAKLKESSQSFHEAQSNVRQLAKDLAEIEQDLLEEQKEDSPYAKAGKNLESARAGLKTAEEKALSGSDIQAQLSGLTGSKLAEQKSSILNLDPGYLMAKSKLDAAGSEVDHVRRELFAADKDWKETADSLTKARKEQKEAEEKTHTGSGRMSNTLTARNAAEAAAAARAAIAQAEAMIRSVGGKPNTTSSSNASRNSPAVKK